MEELIFSISTDIFEQIRKTWKKYGMLDDEMVDVIKKLLRNWRTKKPFGIKIQTTQNTIQGMCWNIYIDKDYLVYFLEEYKKTKVIVKFYKILLREIKKVEYQGKSSSKRPFPINIHHIHNSPICSFCS